MNWCKHRFASTSSTLSQQTGMYSVYVTTNSGIPFNHIMRLTTNLSHRGHGNPFGWKKAVFKLFPIDISRNINNLMATGIWNVCISYIHGHITLTSFKHYIVDIIYMRKEYIFLHNKGRSMIYMYLTCAKTYYTSVMVGITLLRLLNPHDWCNDAVRK